MHTVKGARRRWPRGTWMRPKHEIIHAMIKKSPHSYTDVARYLDCSKQMVGHLAKEPERGKGAQTCGPELATKLAVFLGVPVEAIFDVTVPTASSGNATVRRAA